MQVSFKADNNYCINDNLKILYELLLHKSISELQKSHNFKYFVNLNLGVRGPLLTLMNME